MTYLMLLISQLFLVTSHGGEKTTSSSFSDKIEKKVVKIAKDKNIPSLSLTITKEQDVVAFDYHHKELEKQRIYGIGSSTKLLSAILIFKLVEDGKIGLEDKVTDYIKPNKSILGIESMTIKNLLNHTSGLSDYTKHPDWIKNIIEDKAPRTFDEKLQLINDKTEKRGSFSYSNTNYLFLEKVVEAVTNQAYDRFFNEFYKNNKLPDIQMGADENGLQAFFGQSEKGSSDVSAWREYYGYDGGAYANTKILNEFLIKFFKNKSILKPATISQMEQWIAMDSMNIPIGEKGIISEYGNGIMKLKYNGQEYIGHFGGTLKYQSMLFYNPKKNISISIVTNCSGRHYNNVFFQELMPVILDEL